MTSSSVPDLSDERSSTRAAAATVHSLDKAVELLGLLDRATGGLPLAEIARASGLNRSTAYRLLSTLESNRMVMRDEYLRYRLGFRLFELGSAAKGQHLRYHDAAAIALRRVAERFAVTTFLAVRDGDEALFVEQAGGGDRHYVGYPAGRSLPLHAGAASRVLLAFAPPPDIDRLLAGPLAAVTAGTLTDPATLRAELDRIRTTGIAVTDGDVTTGLTGIGAPVRAADGQLVAAVSVLGPTQRLLGVEHAVLVAEVTRLAADISAAVAQSTAGGSVS